MVVAVVVVVVVVDVVVAAATKYVNSLGKVGDCFLNCYLWDVFWRKFHNRNSYCTKLMEKSRIVE